MKPSLSDTKGWLLAAAVSVSLLSSEPNSRAQSATRGFFDETGAAPERPVDEPPACNILRHEHYSDFGVSNGSLDGEADSYYLARYLLHADLHLGNASRVFFQLNSNTELGRRGGPRPSIDRDDFDVHQAFFDVHLPVALPLDSDTTLLVRLGRQELAYGDGGRDGQSFDYLVTWLTFSF